ncbi:MAG: dTDP-4-dehydrorhamnose reductase [Oceanicaulis sp.]
MSARLLILGQSGQLARALQAAAPAAGFIAERAGRSRADLAVRGAVGRLIDAHRPEVVINAAAYTDVDRAEAEPDAALAINAGGAGEAAEAAQRAGARLIHVSTDYVFTSDGPHAEDADPRPANVYGMTKRAGELAVLAAAPGAAVVRAAGTFSGAGGDFPSAMWRLARGEAPIRVVTDQQVTPIFAGDLADRLLALASSRGAAGVFHAPGAPETTWFQMASDALAALAEAGGPRRAPEPITTAQFSRPAARPSDSRLAGARLEAVTGYPPADRRAGLRLALQRWLKDNTEVS